MNKIDWRRARNFSGRTSITDETEALKNDRAGRYLTRVNENRAASKNKKKTPGVQSGGFTKQ